MVKSKTLKALQPIPPIDLRAEYAALRPKIESAVKRVLASGSYILGEQTQLFEKELASYCQVDHAIGVNSGTDAILLALRALDIKAGDEVLVPDTTFIATAEPVVQVGARPVFVDVDPQTLTIDPHLRTILQTDSRISS